MTVSEGRSIIIVGVGSSMSRSLAIWLATLGWHIGLISRSENNLFAIAEEVRRSGASGSKVVHRAADAGDAPALKSALDWCLQQLGGKLDVLSYNAARVSESTVTTLQSDTLELDFKISAVGTLVTGQWFRDNAQLDRVPKGAVKSASQTITRLFAQALPQEYQILVGMPTVTGRIIDPDTGEYFEKFQPDKIIQTLFKPFFEDRENMQGGIQSWKVERFL
ncbi:NAD(P)-binding protein [Penicillium atrosanguineum]|nr:NAD(P)-binding protein [Penicillium atrosanguineum]